MKPESLDELLPELPRIGLSKNTIYRQFVEKPLSDDLVRTLPGLRFRTFGTHDFSASTCTTNSTKVWGYRSTHFTARRRINWAMVVCMRPHGTTSRSFR